MNAIRGITGRRRAIPKRTTQHQDQQGEEFTVSLYKYSTVTYPAKGNRNASCGGGEKEDNQR